MLNDRYMPADASDEYELTREDSGRHSHKHDRKHKKSKKEKKHREGSTERHRHSENKNETEHAAKRPSKHHPADELEDGEIMEDGEVLDAAVVQPTTEGILDSNRTGIDDVSPCQRRSLSPSADNKRQRHSSSSRPPINVSDRAHSRDRSKEAEAAPTHPIDTSRDHAAASKSNKDCRSSRERSRDRSSSRRAREQAPQQPELEPAVDRPSRHSSKDPRHSSRDRPHSSRDPRDYRSINDAAIRSNSRPPEQRSRSDRDRYRDRELDGHTRDRPGHDRQRAAETAIRGERRRRSSRSLSIERRLGGAAASAPRSFEDRERERLQAGVPKSFEERERARERLGYKRSSDERGRDHDRKRHRRSHSSDEDLDLDLPDPDALAAVDPLGRTAAEREAEEERKRLEESRRRRQEILAKHQQSAAVAAPTATAVAAGQQQQQLQEGMTGLPLVDQAAGGSARMNGIAAAEPAAAAGAVEAAAKATDDRDGTATPEGDRSSSDDSQNAPGPVLDIWNKGREAAADGEVNSRAAAAANADEATSQLPVHLVAQTEPNMQSERLRVGGAAGPAAGGEHAAATAAEADAGDDMFAAEDDMFAAEGNVAAAAAAPKKAAVPAGLQDNFDDAEGYYNFQVGEVLDGRYEVFASKGKGVFSTVLRARDLARLVNIVTGQTVAAGTPDSEHPEVAIKVIRSNETMSKAAALEQRILRMLSDKDPDNKKHVIKLLRTFEFRQHVCMVFEPMDMNLRELTLKYGRNVGLNITAVAIYAAQLLVALRHLQQCRVLHADIKPDNILVNARRSKVKICDLGSAMLAGENERTPYLISRFYRAPEVILGLAYDFPMDMWSVGCVLYELFTGKILFPGRTNNEMLKLMMDVKGPFPKKMLKKGIFVDKHFEDDVQTSFALIEEDPVTKQPSRRIITNPTMKHNFAQLLSRAEGDRAQLTALADLLERMCALDPEKRIDPDSALRHPFIKPWLPKKKSGTGAAR